MAAVLPTRPAGPVAAPALSAGASPATDLKGKVGALVAALTDLGMVIEPWQVAAYVTAVRTKPFVVLAGVSGTGKSWLPKVVAGLTGAAFRSVPVRPDWTDSSRTIGYDNLGGQFVPGEFLESARDANVDPSQQHFVLLDEMNLARVEYYLAEFLSVVEGRTKQLDGSVTTEPLIENPPPDAAGNDWSGIGLPANFTVVGSLNMDETTHSFSRKVLDRAFVLEFTTIDLHVLPPYTGSVANLGWSVDDWTPPFVAIRDVPAEHVPTFQSVADELSDANELLSPLQMQVGYRVRDELVIFIANAQDCIDSFVTRSGDPVDPLDLGLSMKVLPRIQGGGPTIKKALDGLAAWAKGTGGGAPRFPITSLRLEGMLRRLEDEGFTSFWL